MTESIIVCIFSYSNLNMNQNQNHYLAWLYPSYSYDVLPLSTKVMMVEETMVQIRKDYCLTSAYLMNSELLATDRLEHQIALARVFVSRLLCGAQALYLNLHLPSPSFRNLVAAYRYESFKYRKSAIAQFCRKDVSGQMVTIYLREMDHPDHLQIECCPWLSGFYRNNLTY